MLCSSSLCNGYSLVMMKLFLKKGVGMIMLIIRVAGLVAKSQSRSLCWKMSIKNVRGTNIMKVRNMSIMTIRDTITKGTTIKDTTTTAMIIMITVIDRVTTMGTTVRREQRVLVCRLLSFTLYVIICLFSWHDYECWIDSIISGYIFLRKSKRVYGLGGWVECLAFIWPGRYLYFFDCVSCFNYSGY